MTHDDQGQLAAEIIRGGGVIAFRTDTFYGLGVDPLNASAVARIRKLKGREDDQPILILISDRDQVEKFILPSQLFHSVAAARWPGPLTLIGQALPEIPHELTAGTNSLGLRLPDDQAVRALVRACGGALTATSANLSGQPPARTARAVTDYFPAGLGLILDGGAVTVTQPSTVLDLSGAEAKLIREGVIPAAALSDYLKFR
jgi:L-threonylcarbamoyladenylate synthase